MLHRRTFLLGAAASAAAASSLSIHRLAPLGAAEPPGFPFTLGVASGDPRPDGVVLWTRLAPDPLAGGGMPDDDVEVHWELAPDASFTDVVASGTETATATFAHSVHAVVDGLAPDTWYAYRFRTAAFTSAVGWTRTTPVSGCATGAMRFGFASCQSYTSGYYAAHRHLAAEGCDLVVFLGDYIYEGGGSGVRTHPGGTASTLGAYRNRYALYKADPDLQAAHAACPWLVVWDDHEVENNYAGAVSQDPGAWPEAAFLDRRAAAYQAWWEHQPVRLPPPIGPDLPIYRDLTWGGLASFHALDTRQYRTDQGCGDGIAVPCPEVDDLDRTMLGPTQEAWLSSSVRASTSTWNVLANQVVFSAMPILGAVNLDQWDGYPAERSRLVRLLADTANPVVVTGDVHLGGVFDITEDWADPTSPVIGTELVGTSISSSFTPSLVDAAEAVIGALPHVRYVNARQRGYTVVDLSAEAMTARFRVVADATDPGSPVATAFVHEVAAEPAGGCTDEPAPEPTSTTSDPAVAAPLVTPRFAG